MVLGVRNGNKARISWLNIPDAVYHLDKDKEAQRQFMLDVLGVIRYMCGEY